MLKFRMIGQTSGKYGNHENEDAYHISPNRFAVVADGAGGAGIYTGEWARYLTDHLPTTAITDYEGLKLFIKENWQSFKETQISRIEKQEFVSKFLREGSWATLAAVWLPALEDAEPIANWMAYGDSAVLHYRPATGKLEGFPEDLKSFEEAPFLVNWKSPPDPAGFKCGTFTLESDSILILCSDALAQHILIRYALDHPGSSWALDLDSIRQSPRLLGEILEKLDKDGARSPFANIADDFKDALETPEKFKDFVDLLRSRGTLAQDDYTLVVIDSTT
jgi:hypothetical protein